MRYANKVLLILLFSVLGTLTALRTAKATGTCPLLQGAGWGIQDMIYCDDSAVCGPSFLWTCIRFTCSGHPGFCGQNCGRLCDSAGDCRCPPLGLCDQDCP